MAHAALGLAGTTGLALREIPAVLPTRGAPETPPSVSRRHYLANTCEQSSVAADEDTATGSAAAGVARSRLRGPGRCEALTPQEHANLGEAGHSGHLGHTPLSSGAPSPSRMPRSVQSAAGGPGCVRPWRWRPRHRPWLAGGRTSRRPGGRAAAWPPARRPAGRSSSSGGSR